MAKQTDSNNLIDKWDFRFLQMAKLVASWSKDPSTKVGSVIVRPNKTICSVGFNGFPQNMHDDQNLYLNRDEKYDRNIHAEMNALLFTKESVKEYILYTYPFGPCSRCCVHQLQAGIKQFIFPLLPDILKERWGVSIDKSKQYIQECGGKYLEVDFK